MIRTLIVDDSAFMRMAIRSMLASSPDIKIVGDACNGKEAVEKSKALHPDIIIMDVNMPVMDGLTAVKTIMSTDPVPIIMFSTLTTEGSKEALEALQLGAIDFTAKSESHHDVNKAERELVDKIRNIHSSNPNILRLINMRKFKGEVVRGKWKCTGNFGVLVGSSTGGPSSLEQVIPRLPADLPAPVFVVQHMPEGGFCRQLAERLNFLSELEVKEARNNEKVNAGVVYIAPGGYHMTVRKALDIVRIKLVKGQPVHAVMPAVDVTAESVLDVYGKNIVAAILTGMGVDGAAGFKKIRDAGGSTIACSEDTCVIFGMPKAAIEAGGIDIVKPLFEIPEEIVRMSEVKCSGK
ncbi:Chemotaxis response regulator protein-glutamate methylesterase CheB [Methanosarcina horonobensis HB-1 = JCM 15518]|uniref:Protein-glutamate methylesterase/protein-glutamine glutaminase n=1 Tax=Methanosarcina horonobensis HB-1 = JCM 15518 TaxID=1434110 RepID=A0A0E3SDS2_9EURY|nr:chemotaxis response regulator protein-glutamate methylesterase [Methanosarcina horonobensis]AKB77633.1 Chemotaxis response regulator protein-glutamate methylesterase CheB [Methanosarcina horonobensis HB-1 = JCM 15518]